MRRADMETASGLKLVGTVPQPDIDFTLTNNQHLPVTVHRRNDSTIPVFRHPAAALPGRVEAGAGRPAFRPIWRFA